MFNDEWLTKVCFFRTPPHVATYATNFAELKVNVERLKFKELGSRLAAGNP